MGKLKVIGSSEFPLNSAGFLTPVFQKCNGECFQAGDDRSTTFSEDLVKKDAANKAGISFETVTLNGPLYTVKALCQVRDSEQILRLPAYVLYFQRGILYPSDEEMLIGLISGHGSIPLEPQGGVSDGEFCFRLLPIDQLVQLLPEILNKLQALTTDALAESIDFYPQVKGDRVAIGDNLWQLAEMMSNLAHSRETAAIAMKYEALMLLLSPKADNIRVWLKTISARWGLPSSPELWIDHAWSIFDKAERMVIEAKKATKREVVESVEKTGVLEKLGVLSQRSGGVAYSIRAATSSEYSPGFVFEPARERLGNKVKVSRNKPR